LQVRVLPGPPRFVTETRAISIVTSAHVPVGARQLEKSLAPDATHQYLGKPNDENP
jgi:hypothetical protein